MSQANHTVRFESSRQVQVHRVIRSGFGLLLGAAALVASLTLLSTPVFAAQPEHLTLQNGWRGEPFGTGRAMVEKVNGIVHFWGAISASGTITEPFILPESLRPSTNVFIPVDLCNAAKGRLVIAPSGVVNVQAEGNVFINAQCFTSLEGASFAQTADNFTALTLVNGWTNAPFGTSNAEVRKISGIVHFKGAIATSGTNSVAFTLPSGFHPSKDVYISIDLCNAATGRLHITPSGVADVETEGDFSDAQCFTSLDGAWFAQTDSNFSPLSLINGWTNGPFSTGNAAAGGAYGVVYLKGAIATSGTNPVPFVLPPAFRPLVITYVHLDTCGATNGRLLIQTDGTVSVQVELGHSFSDAQCFTSLDGVSFVQ